MKLETLLSQIEAAAKQYEDCEQSFQASEIGKGAMRRWSSLQNSQRSYLKVLNPATALKIVRITRYLYDVVISDYESHYWAMGKEYLAKDSIERFNKELDAILNEGEK